MLKHKDFFDLRLLKYVLSQAIRVLQCKPLIRHNVAEYSTRRENVDTLLNHEVEQVCFVLGRRVPIKVFQRRLWTNILT